MPKYIQKLLFLCMLQQQDFKVILEKKQTMWILHWANEPF